MLIKQNIFFKFILVNSLIIGSFSYSQNLSFSEALNLMNENNSLIKAAEKTEEVHKFELKATQGLRFPKVEANATGLYLDQEYGVDLNGARNMAAGLLQIPDPSILGNWNVGVLKRGIFGVSIMATAPIFTGGKINAAINASKIKSSIGEKETQSVKNKLITELAQRYFQVKLADEAVIVRKQVLEGMNKHLYDATKLEKEGIIAPVEKLNADIAVSEATRQYLAAQKDAALSRTALAGTLEKDNVSENLSSNFFNSQLLKPLEYYQENAVNNYPELQKLKLQADLADQGIKAKESSYYPTIGAFGGAFVAHNNPIEIGEQNMKPWAVGVSISYTLFEGFKNKNEIKAAKATRESIDFYQTKNQKDIKILIEKIYFDIQKQEEQIQNLTTQQTRAEELLRVRTKAFSEGLSTSTDVSDAELNLSSIKLQKLQANYIYVTDLASLLEYSGLSQEFSQYTN